MDVDEMHIRHQSTRQLATYTSYEPVASRSRSSSTSSNSSYHSFIEEENNITWSLPIDIHDIDTIDMAIMSTLEQEFFSRPSLYNAEVEQIREKHYPTLSDTTYLDFAAATPYSNTLIDLISDDLKANLFGNPHSLSSSSQLTTKRIDDVRLNVLQMFGADPEVYDIVFVQNTTAAIKMVAEIFRDAGKLRYICHQDAHTSLVGIRRLLTDSCMMNTQQVEEWLEDGTEYDGGLLAYPLQSNFSGRRMPLDWARRARRLGYYTLADAAAYATSTPIHLGQDGPDFMAVSFLKIFGYPDLAGLIVRRENPLLQYRKFFGGGTVDFLINGNKSLEVVRKTIPHEFLEDGTPPFHAIVALGIAMKHHKELFKSFTHISHHTTSLMAFTWKKFSNMKHANGNPIAEIYTEGTPTTDTQGATLTFNMKRSDGTFIGYNEVSRMAEVCNIQLRTGGLCNSGGVMYWTRTTEADMLSNMEAGKKCDDDNDIINGKPTGAIRISFAAMSTVKDAIKFLEFVHDHYIERSTVINTPMYTNDRCRISKITIFPIKSCAGYDITTEWRLMPSGLEWDREWCLVHLGTTKALSQKQFPSMASIKPSILKEQLVVNAQGKTLCIDLSRGNLGKTRTRICNGKVCTENVALDIYEDADIAQWFSEVVGTACTLARTPPVNIRQSRFDTPLQLSNESPLLVVNDASYTALTKDMKVNKPALDVFRANIVVSGGNVQPYSEDNWSTIKIGNEILQMLSPCRRCQMICINQETGEKNPEPYLTLSKTRKRNGKIFFGVHAKHISTCHPHGPTHSSRNSAFSSIRSRVKSSHSRGSSTSSMSSLLPPPSMATTIDVPDCTIRVGDLVTITERRVPPESPDMRKDCLTLRSTSCLPTTRSTLANESTTSSNKPSTSRPVSASTPLIIKEKLSVETTNLKTKRLSSNSFTRLSFGNEDKQYNEKRPHHKRASSWFSAFTSPARTLMGNVGGNWLRS